MNAATVRQSISGPAGAIDCAIDTPTATPIGVAVSCHPHPQHGGTMDNKVVQTLARAFVQLGYRSIRFNFRGVGASGGAWDHGRGEVDDARAVAEAFRAPGLPLVLAGFSFGGYVAATLASQLAASAPVERLVLVAPAVVNFVAPPVPQDTIVLHGEADDVVPLAALLDWARPQVLPVTVVPATGHFFHGQLPLLRQLVTRSF